LPLAAIDGIELEYETFGNPDDPAMLLIMGLGCQLILWDDDFCAILAGRGFHVIRFDNRDIGLSTKIEDGPVPDIVAALAGDASSASYTIDDMAADAVGLLDALDIAAAHVVGVSMGGMIAQQIAIAFPERVLSLCSIMSTTGDQNVGQPRQEALAALIAPAEQDRESQVEFAVRAFTLIGSPGYPPDADYIRRFAGASYDRCYYPPGFARQLVAVLASRPRTEALAAVHAPTLVIHGEEDPLIQVSGGEATARAIPGAKLMKIPGMGHDLPPALWPEIVDAIVDNAARGAVVG
jgi:pimeloyl-ACP methyl ester carboxylesterase